MDSYFNNKNKNKLIITNMIDQNEKQHLLEFIESADKSSLQATKLYDLNGDISGLAIGVKEPLDNTNVINKVLVDTSVIRIVRNSYASISFELLDDDKPISLDGADLLFIIKEDNQDVVCRKYSTDGIAKNDKGFFEVTLYPEDTENLSDACVYSVVLCSKYGYNKEVLSGKIIIED